MLAGHFVRRNHVVGVVFVPNDEQTIADVAPFEFIGVLVHVLQGFNHNMIHLSLYGAFLAVLFHVGLGHGGEHFGNIVTKLAEVNQRESVLNHLVIDVRDGFDEIKR